MSESLETFTPDGLERVLVVVAHPDDAEYGASCAVAAWTAQGVAVTYLLLTRGEAGIRGMPPERTAVVREAEQRAGCAAVGVSDVRFLDHPDGLLQHTPQLRRDIARVIREVRPQLVVTPTWELEAPWGLNHVDHRVCGLAVVDAMRDADNPWLFPELLEEGLEPWATQRLMVAGHTRLTHGVDVSGPPLEAGIASLEAHEAYLAALPWHPAPRQMLAEMTAGQGQRIGVANAVLVRVI
ncbi:PIG-L deacetylase family protein [Serinibacter salmoneus]|uniref:LmbE family N-acetylglucosaminyl deacetylase n=1 Tax=Serinibacter salmoneus TaxID=556530 RepID=A0A2A9D4S8_9MICO|nr:PIG-L deacetylase family protein [Serinibacter salmoneus]PFG20859.1 LmbE family N-acetylglucosaminyl deacetylase [Serinibacter salmoneus]